MDGSISIAPPGGDVNRGPVILAVGWVECVLAFAFLCGRWYARLKFRQVGWDDWVMVVSFLLALAFVSIATPEVYYGTGRHVYYLTQSQRIKAVKLNWTTQAFHIMSTAMAKISIVLLMLRIIRKNRTQMWLLCSMVFALFVISVVCVALIFAQCSPSSALWDLSVHGNCWDPKVQQAYGYFTASYSAFTDIALALFPVSVLWNLQMKIRVKISLAIIMGLGIFAAAAAIIKTIQLKSLSARGDYTYDTVDLIIWMMTEQFVIIIAASVPPMRALFVSFSDKPQNVSSSNRKGSRRPYTSGLSLGRKGYYPYFDDGDSHALQSVTKPPGVEGAHAVAYHEKVGSDEEVGISRGNDGESLENISHVDTPYGITKTTKVEVTYDKGLSSSSST